MTKLIVLQESPPVENGKRHTARRVASTRETCPGERGYPSHGQGDTPALGYPLEGTSDPQSRTWHQSLGCLPPERKWDKWLAVLWNGDGVPPEGTWDQWLLVLWDGVIPPPPVLTDTCENMTSRRTTYAGGKKWGPVHILLQAIIISTKCLLVYEKHSKYITISFSVSY